MCAAFQFSTQRQFSLRLPVYVRSIGSTDRTSAIGLEVKQKSWLQNTNTLTKKCEHYEIKTLNNLPLTIYPHTWRGTRGYKVIPEVAAYTQSH